jgi:hypothetical protein
MQKVEDFTMAAQLDEEKSYLHPHILLQSFMKSKKYITIESVKDIHNMQLPYVDYIMHTTMNGDKTILGVEGKRDKYKIEKDFNDEHMVSEIFGHVSTSVLNLKTKYSHCLKRRIGKGTTDYKNLRKDILELIEKYDVLFPSIKYGYGFVDDFNLPYNVSPIFSYLWYRWNKAGIFKGNLLRDFTKKCFYEEDPDCKFQLSPNKSWVTVNLLIPFKKLKENNLLIKLIDFDEKSISPDDKILMLNY